MRWPDNVSWMTPFSSPRWFCCSLNSRPVRAVIHFMPKKRAGTTVNVTAVSAGLSHSMTEIVPVKVSTLEKIWITELFSVELTFSISFVARLISSPCCLRSKKASGMACRWRNSRFRIVYTVCWAMRIIVKFCSHIVKEWPAYTAAKPAIRTPSAFVSPPIRTRSTTLPTKTGPISASPELSTTMAMTRSRRYLCGDSTCASCFSVPPISDVRARRSRPRGSGACHAGFG